MVLANEVYRSCPLPLGHEGAIFPMVYRVMRIFKRNLQPVLRKLHKNHGGGECVCQPLFFFLSNCVQPKPSLSNKRGHPRWDQVGLSHPLPSLWSVSSAGAPCELFSSSALLKDKTIFLSGPKTSSPGLACADPTGLSFAPGDGAACGYRRHPSSLRVSISQARDGRQALWTRHFYIPAGFS